MKYNHEEGSGRNADEMLKHVDGKGQCQSWAQLLGMILRAQGVPADDFGIYPKVGRNRFEVKPMPAQGTSGQDYGERKFRYHQIVRVDVYPTRIYDPSYGEMTEKTDARAVELKYEDVNVTRHLTVADDGTILESDDDVKGVLELQWL